MASELIFAVDPGNIESAYVIWDGEAIIDHGTLKNRDMLSRLSVLIGPCRTYIEMIASYGMPVGREVFDTCVWIGRFFEVAPDPELIFRQPIKLHHCGSARAKVPTLFKH